MSLTPHSYASGLFENGGSKNLLRILRDVDYQTSISGVKPVYTLGHLAAICGMSHEKMISLIEATDNYKSIEIPKRSRAAKGKKSTSSNASVRVLKVPENDLRIVQRRILQHCIPGHNISSNSYAYERGKNTLQLAERHIGAKCLIKFDIRDFFNKISTRHVFRVFKNSGYPDLLSMQLALLCTADHGAYAVAQRKDSERVYSIAERGILPQGAPTSGLLSNHVLKGFDRIMNEYSIRKGAVFTRYADDFHLSFGWKLKKAEQASAINSVARILKAHGFELNKSKTSVLSNSNSMNVLGLRIHESGVSVNANYKKRLNSLLYALEKYGAADFASHLTSDNLDHLVDEYQILSQLYGHYCYVRGVDEGYANSIGRRVKKLVGPLFSM